MPFEYNGQIVVRKEDLIPDFFPTWNALRRKLDRDAKKPEGIRRARQGKGLNNDVLIIYDTLPYPIRQQIRDPRKVDCILERYFWEDSEAVRFYLTVRIGKYGMIQPERQKQYVLDASVLKAAVRLRAAHITECISRGILPKNTDKYLAECVNIFNDFRTIKKLSLHTLPVNHVRLKDKIKRFEAEGYNSLLSGYDNNNATKKTERIMNLLNAMYVQKEKPTQVEVSRLYEGFLNGYVEVINPETGEMYNPADYGKLSTRTITSFLASWKEKVATHLKRSANRQEYMTKFDPYQSLEQPEFAGSILSIDDRQPPFVYNKDRDRMWFYNGFDLGSECIMAFVWGKDKKEIIIPFYRELVRNCAEWGVSIPAELECESALNASHKGTFLREGCMFDYVRILANEARSKRVERYFGNIRYNLEKERAGWIGRPKARNEAYQTDPNKIEVVPYDTLVRNCLEDIMTWNNSQHSNQERFPNKTRWEVFMENQHPELKPINWMGILPFIGDKTETSVRVGQIRLNNNWFLLGDNGTIHTGDALLDVMDLLEGKDVDVYWLPGHNGQTLKALVYLEDRCICEAVSKPIAKRSQLEAKNDPQAAANLELVEKYKNTVRGWAQRHKNEIEKLIIVDKRPKTLNSGFQITWVEGLSSAPVYQPKDIETVEILETVETEFNNNLMGVETDYQRASLKDRY